MTAGEVLEAGRQILASTMQRHGFRWVLGLSGPSSGGEFASGEYVRDSRCLKLHFRYSLGLVSYHVGEMSVGHVDYMRLAGVKGQRHQYPGFSDDPLDGFRHLKHDLESYCRTFLAGSDDEFVHVVQEATEAARIAAKKRLP